MLPLVLSFSAVAADNAVPFPAGVNIGVFFGELVTPFAVSPSAPPPSGVYSVVFFGLQPFHTFFTHAPRWFSGRYI